MLRTIARLDAKTSFALLVLAVLVLVVPKVTLVSFGPYEGAGLRVEDFLILLIFGLLGPIWVWQGSALTRVEAAFFWFLLASLLSLLINTAFDRGSILYILRLLEYWALFYAGALAMRYKLAVMVLSWILILNCVAISLQYFHVVGGWSNGVFVSELSRPTGLTNGSYEAPFVVGLISVFLMGRLSGWRLYGSMLIAVSAILMTGARIVLVSYLAAFLLSLLPTQSKRAVNRHQRLLASLSMLAIVATTALLFTPQVFERFGGLVNVKLISTEVAELYSNAVGERNSATGPEFERSQPLLRTQDAKSYIEEELSLSTDLSLLVRANKWFWGLKSFFSQDIGMYFVGVGPGSMGNALDSGLLRVFLETGVIGILALTYFLLQVTRINRALLLPSVVFFTVCNTMIDYYLASKPMMTFLFIIGVSLGIRQEIRDRDTAR